MRISVVGLVFAVAAVLVGCGAAAAVSPPAGGPAAAAPATAVPSPAAPPGPVTGTGPTARPGTPTPSATPLPAPGPGQPVTVPGVVRAGARPGCDTLFADDGRHYLLLDVSDPPLGVPVEVTGIPDPTLLSYCNSGVALHVQRISRR